VIDRAIDRDVKATVYRAFAERTFLEKNPDVGYELPREMFREWWLTLFWTTDHLCDVGYKEAALSLHFMAAMVEAGDA
jgi:hypothetical protein